MRALLQRVKMASVMVEETRTGAINQGVLVFLGIQNHDNKNIANKLLNKILRYRLFSDDQQKMNLSVDDISGGLLLVPQFTLAADTQKGLRPGFSFAAKPQMAKSLYDYVVAQAEAYGRENNISVASGLFGADMQVSLINDGPVTFLLEQ